MERSSLLFTAALLLIFPAPLRGDDVPTTTQVPLSGRLMPWDPRNLPGPGWPGPTEEISQQAWPTGRQPQVFDAYPHDGKKPSPCWKTTVLIDSQDELFYCEDLERTPAADQASCEATCKEDPDCSVWQWMSTQECLQGPGLECVDLEPTLAKAGAATAAPTGAAPATATGRRLQWKQATHVVRAQRIMHGESRLLKDMRGWEVEHLRYIGGGPANPQEAIEYCRNVCKSRILCQYWQLSSIGECYIEDPRKDMMGFGLRYKAQYPLTTDGGATASSRFAGEYIQHICPAHPQRASAALQRSAAAPTRADDGELGANSADIVRIVAIAGGGAFLLFALAFCIHRSLSSASKKQTSRALDVSTREEQPLNGSDESDMGETNKDFERGLAPSAAAAAAAATPVAPPVSPQRAPPGTAFVAGSVVAGSPTAVTPTGAFTPGGASPGAYVWTPTAAQSPPAVATLRGAMYPPSPGYAQLQTMSPLPTAISQGAVSAASSAGASFVAGPRTPGGAPGPL